MIAWINGDKVEGTPGEIAEYKQLTKTVFSNKVTIKTKTLDEQRKLNANLRKSFEKIPKDNETSKTTYFYRDN